MRLGSIAPNQTTQPMGWFSNVLQNALQTYGQYLTLEQQRELLKIQNQRAAQNLPPLDVSQYTPGVSVGVESSTQRTLLIGVGLLVGGLLLTKAIR